MLVTGSGRNVISALISKMFTQSGCGAVCQHESRIEASIFDEKCWKLRVGGIDQAFNPSFAHCGQLVYANGQVIKSFGGIFSVEVAS